jgi:cellulose synthase/poly-beta-1,6-N-acetylglucosamine synthase-like glycosyltransferase
VVGGDGAIYAIRKRLFRPLEDDDLSDFVLPLEIVVAGYRGVFQDSAHCSEEVAGSFSGEFRRKVRIVNRALTAVMRVPAALNPDRVGWFALQLLLHKVLRWFVPYLLLVALAANTALVLTGASDHYLYLLVVQLVLYGLAVLGGIPAFRGFTPIYILFYFCLVNTAALQGTMRALRGHSLATWQPERG